jgi:hypothetical protein
MAPHILMGEEATVRIVLIGAFVLVSAALTLVAGVVWLMAGKSRPR